MFINFKLTFLSWSLVLVHLHLKSEDTTIILRTILFTIQYLYAALKVEIVHIPLNKVWLDWKERKGSLVILFMNEWGQTGLWCTSSVSIDLHMILCWRDTWLVNKDFISLLAVWGENICDNIIQGYMLHRDSAKCSKIKKRFVTLRANLR